MDGFFNLPTKVESRTATYYATGTSSFTAWHKPQGAAMIHFTVVGGGAGGGSGCYSGSSPLAGTLTLRGGAGGGAGNLVSATIPAFLLPDTLYLQVGRGGEGGARVSDVIGIGGQSGEISYVCAYPEINSGSVILKSSTSQAIGGQGGNISPNTVPSGGLQAITTNPTNSFDLSYIAIIGDTYFQQNKNGGNGGDIIATSIVSLGDMLSGGNGGAGATRSSTGVVSPGASGSTSLLSAYSELISVPDNGDPVFNTQYLITRGGAGGSAATTGASTSDQDGKPGGFGCGGGGGGAGVNPGGFAGAGGKGGDGLIIITYT